MSNYHFNAPVTGQVQAGDHTTMNVNQPAVSAGSPHQADQRQTEVVLTLAQQLVDILARENPPLRSHAEEVRGELARSEQEGSAPDTGRIRQRLELISAGVGAGSGVLELVRGIIHAIGG